MQRGILQDDSFSLHLGGEHCRKFDDEEKTPRFSIWYFCDSWNNWSFVDDCRWYLRYLIWILLIPAMLCKNYITHVFSMATLFVSVSYVFTLNSSFFFQQIQGWYKSILLPISFPRVWLRRLLHLLWCQKWLQMILFIRTRSCQVVR